MKTLRLIKARLVAMSNRLDGVVELATPLGDFNESYIGEIAAHEGKLRDLRRRLRQQSYATHGQVAGAVTGGAAGAALARGLGRSSRIGGGAVGALLGVSVGGTAGSIIRRKQRERK